MRCLKYLNSILTILTVLLALQLWTTWTSPIPTQASDVVSLSDHYRLVQTAQAAGIPNAGSQRRQMIDMLTAIHQETEKLNRLLESGRVRVRIESSAPDGQPN